jgi:hypothetical protein
MYKRIKVERYVIPMVCGRCSYAWNYTGKNEYVATCPLCRTKLSIKKNNRIDDTPGQSADIALEGKSKWSNKTNKTGMALQRHPNSVLTYRIVKEDELL